MNVSVGNGEWGLVEREREGEAVVKENDLK